MYKTKSFEIETQDRTYQIETTIYFTFDEDGISEIEDFDIDDVKFTDVNGEVHENQPLPPPIKKKLVGLVDDAHENEACEWLDMWNEASVELSRNW